VAAGLGTGSRADRQPEDVAGRSVTRMPAARAQERGRLGSGKPVTFAFGGDIHFESPIRERLASSPASVLRPVAPVLRAADIAVVNLETAVTGRGTPASKAYVFRSPASAFAALEAGGVDVTSVANNHGMDFGVVGLRDTLSAGRRAGMPLIGAGYDDKQAYAPYRATVRGQRIAIIGATQVLDDHLISAWTAGRGKPGLASAKDEPRLLRAVREARGTSDTVVVFLHWGLELYACATETQRSLARKLVAAGADIVVGSHAHVLVGAGKLGKALVAYGLGNFVFYASRAETTESGVLEVTATGRRIDSYRWRPARISNGIPHPLTGSERSRAVARWNALRGCTGLRR
jgi:poly-gamma-glutamate synthesis protein (capsule biosynthesis protein)